MADKYYIKANDQKIEITQEQFISAERANGFHPKPGCGPCATGGFSSSTGIMYSVEYDQS